MISETYQNLLQPLGTMILNEKEVSEKMALGSLAEKA
jgi:hypothetical protein